MSDESRIGKILWTDLTVPNASEVRDFYARVVGWTAQAVDMGDYADYSMIPPGSEQAVTGICHQRGMNAALPAQWLVYLVVEDLAHSLAECAALGGQIIVGPRELGADKMCVIRDPAGAVVALYQFGAQNA